MKNHTRILHDLVALIPVLKAAIPADVAVAVSDLEKWIASSPGENIDVQIRPGQLIRADEPLAKVLAEDIQFKASVPAEYYGFEFIGTAVPIHDEEGHVIGGLCMQMRRQTEIRAIADQITSALSQANQRIENILQGSSHLSEFTRKLQDQSAQAGNDVKNTDVVLTVIGNVASQTHLLGLNAAIEAAHAGDKGRGFEVVAKEIRKFSQETVTSTKMIRNTMTQIQDITGQIGKSIQQIASIGEEQAASTEQIAEFVEEIRQMAEKLNRYASTI